MEVLVRYVDLIDAGHVGDVGAAADVEEDLFGGEEVVRRRGLWWADSKRAWPV